MGNANILRDKFGCEDISRQDFIEIKTRRNNYQQGYLYQTDIEKIGEEKLKVMSFQMNVLERQNEVYFQRLNMMSKYLNKGNLHLPLLCISQNKNQCTCMPETNEIVKIYYQPYEIVLAEEIKARARWKEGFSQKQLWYIMFNAINGLRQFEPFAEPSGNLSLHDILMNSKGELKLKTFLSTPYEPQRISVLANYFSPQELVMMRQVYGQQGPLTRNLYKQYNTNPNICQVYSLAIILLILATGVHYTQLYTPPFNLNQSMVLSCLCRLPDLGYSKLLVNLLRTMLSSYPNRPLPSQIYHVFKQFQFQIMNFQPFSFSLASSMNMTESVF